MVETTIPTLQWFPGHMKRARRIVEENLPLVDVVMELLDARIPVSSANPLLQEIIGDKPRLIVLNKADLADRLQTKKWLAFFAAQNLPAVAVACATGQGLKELTAKVTALAAPQAEKLVARGAKKRAARAMILGIPNVGKSSLINRLAGAAKAKTANTPGLTRAKQWIKIGASLELLDTPGILWPKFEDMTVGLKLAFTGAIKDEIYDREGVAALLLEFLGENYPRVLKERYKLAEISQPPRGQEILADIGRRRGCLLKGGLVDLEKTERIVLSEFRAGKLGKITLENPPVA
ncbi:MAG: ribosome biogenesis GTPase YlqF [Selenomonadaceae bacterium]|nr:ribosome biogenesis GTPase YlqF [Selenomonadaceae bacterium]